jgi:hypothetical protein
VGWQSVKARPRARSGIVSARKNEETQVPAGGRRRRIDTQRALRRRRTAFWVTAVLLLPAVPLAGGGLIGAMLSAIAFGMAGAVLLAWGTYGDPRDPVARAVVRFAGNTALSIGFSAVALLLFLMLLAAVASFLVSGTLPDLILAQHPDRRLTVAEGLVLAVVFANGFTGGALLLAGTRRSMTRVSWRITACPGLGRRAIRLARRIGGVSVSIAGSLLALYAVLVVMGTDAIWPARMLDAVPVVFIALVAAVAVLAAAASAMTWLYVLPRRLLVTIRLLWRLSGVGSA